MTVLMVQMLLLVLVYRMLCYRDELSRPDTASANEPHGIDQGLANTASMKLVLTMAMKIGDLTAMILFMKKPPTAFVTPGNVNIVMLPLPMPLLHLISVMTRPEPKILDSNACQTRRRLGRGG